MNCLIIMINFAALLLLLYLFPQSPVPTGMSTTVSEMHVTGTTNDAVTFKCVHVRQAAHVLFMP